MLVHPWDSPVDEAEVWSFVRAQGFGHLIAPGRGEVPVVVPTQFVLDEATPRPHVLLHLARPNPVWAALDENPTVVLSLAGDWAYIPSSWKVVDGEDAAMGIPTTYYAAAQLVGKASVIDDPTEKAAVLRRQLGVLEPAGGAADPSQHGRKLAGIRAISITVTEVAGKFKYGGNVDDAHRSVVRAHLTARGGPGDAAAIAHMQRRTPAGVGVSAVETTADARAQQEPQGES